MYQERGFLSAADPVDRLPGKWSFLDDVLHDLPDLILEKKLRSIVKELPVLDFDDVSDSEQIKCLMRHYSYLASAYVWGAPNEAAMDHIPKMISVPLVQLSEKVGRPPILSYASYCLDNWRVLNKSKGIQLGNIEIIQKFVKCYDEDWFILIHVDIEAKGALALQSIADARLCCAVGRSPEKMLNSIKSLRKSLVNMNETMRRMPEKCSPDIYYKEVRPYIYGFNNIVYEDCFDDKPQSFRGETGAQSSLIPSIQSALGIRHKESKLTEHLDDMRKYMPPHHREYVRRLDDSVPPYNEEGGFFSKKNTDIRKFVIDCKNKDIISEYNQCIEEFWKFRTQHLKYAVDYIYKKVTDPKGTGGTNYMHWLKDLCDETLDFIIK